MAKLKITKINTSRVRSKLNTIFCVILAMFLLLCMVQLYLTVKVDGKFKYQKYHPELEMRPIINGTSKNLLIWYNENDVTTVDRCIKLTDDFVEAYIMQPDPPKVASTCDFKHPPQRGQTCPVDMDNFGPCVAPFYGYYSFSPCIFLKLSKIYGWIPSYYSVGEILSSSMPKDLITAIRNTDVRHESKQVWVSCEGEHDVDKESIEAINYYPNRGFPSYYFPVKYKNDEYLSPLIAVEIVNPKPGFIISIICRAFSRDTDYRNSEQNQFIVRFGIMREEQNYQGEQYQ